MNRIVIFLLILVPALANAQRYEVSLTDLRSSTTPFTRTTNKIDLTDADWRNDARLLITGVTANDLRQVRVTLHRDSFRIVAPELGLVGDTAVYLLSTVIDQENAYDLYFNNRLAGTIVFQVSTAIIPPDPEVVNENPDSVFQAYVGVLAGLNFLGDRTTISNLTPVINLGGVAPLLNIRNWFTWELDVNPYLGGEIETRDSVAYVPALMLYGRVGLAINNYVHFNLEKSRITVMPFAFGLKFIPNLQDSSNVVIQHNIRFGLAYRYNHIFLLSGQITKGWHNITSLSERAYRNIFGNYPTDITYMLLTGQFTLSGANQNVTNYIFFEWRGLLSKNRLPGFLNNRTLSIGFRKSFELSGSGVFAAGSGGNRRSRNKIHYPIQ